jgi:hypothetical protein
MQAAQDITIGARVFKAQYQYTLVDVDSDEVDHWPPILLKNLQTLPQLTGIASDQQSTGRVWDMGDRTQHGSKRNYLSRSISHGYCCLCNIARPESKRRRLRATLHEGADKTDEGDSVRPACV